MKTSYLTFDCYGTLIDWKKGIEDNFKNLTGYSNPQNAEIFENYIRIESNEERDYSTYKQVLASTFLDLARYFDLSPSEDKAHSFADSITRWPAFSDTVSTLVALGKRGFKRVILSNIDRELLEETIRNNRLEVDGYITAEDVRSYKPQDAHWLRMLKQYGVNRDEVIHIAGSVYHDIVPASRLGFKTVWVNRYKERDPIEVKPTYSVNSLSEILEVI